MASATRREAATADTHAHRPAAGRAVVSPAPQRDEGSQAEASAIETPRAQVSGPSPLLPSTPPRPPVLPPEVLVAVAVRGRSPRADARGLRHARRRLRVD